MHNSFKSHFMSVLIDSEIKGDVLFLGYYDSEFDWTNETAKVKLKINVLNLFIQILFSLNCSLIDFFLV